jgi:hypothetical protein
VEGELDHPVGREQVSEAVDVPAQEQVTALGQDIGGRGGWHEVPSRQEDFVQRTFIEQT